MTTIDPVIRSCALCRGESRQYILGSTSSIGYPDLDLRPAEPARSALWTLVQRCPHCGYCASDIAESAPNAHAEGRTMVESEPYRRQLNAEVSPELANSFLCSALILEYHLDELGAAHATLHAAWACDDDGTADAVSGYCRHLAVHRFREASEDDWQFAPSEAWEQAVIADLLRRSHQFDEADDEYRVGLRVSGDDDEVRRILDFGRALADKGDAARHSIAEVLG